MGRWVTPLLFAVATAFSTPPALSQSGSIAGTVHDQESGEELVGVNILLVGTSTGTSTDIEGKFLLRSVTPGIYSVRFTFVGYGTKVISGVNVPAVGTLRLDVLLASEAYKQDEVVVTAERMLGTEAAILADRKKAATIGDGVSAEQIRHTPDATSGDALKRVTGLSIVDNKFVFIRGVTDRYNSTTLDGASVSSTEAGKKGFSFDLLPANLLENSTVVKSATPDLPGDFTGGLVQLNTLDFPDHLTLKAGVQTAYNSLTTGVQGFRSQGGSTDWLGIDDGIRSYPGNNPDGNAFARSLPNTWAPRSAPARPNMEFGLSYGDRLLLDDADGGEDQLGFLAALTYKNALQRNLRTVNDRDQGRFSAGTRDDFSVLWGGIANLSWKFGGLHKISLKNNYNRSGEDQLSAFDQDDISNNLMNEITITNWTERSIYTGQLVGEHVVPSLGGFTVQWRGMVSSSRRRDPDRKEMVYYRQIDDPTQPMTVGYNKRSWAGVDDRSLGASLDLTYPLGIARLKAGVFSENKTSAYAIRYFRGTPDYFGGIPDSLTRLPISTIYSPENFGPQKFLFGEVTRPSDSYTGDQTLLAAYAMVDLPFEVASQHFRFTGGVRSEAFRQDVSVPETMDPASVKMTNRLQATDLLPSVNLTYMVTENANIRLAYSHSVNRPEFRERSTTIFEDFLLNELIAGNPALSRAYVRNYDARIEVFPGIGEVVAFSYFQKIITGAIEEELLLSGTRTRLFFNSEHASNHGFELELRKSFGFLGSYFNAFSITGNYSRIYSAVRVTETVGNSTDTRYVDATRPMQGQSPYMINLSLLFTEPTLGTSVSILYNTSGRRLHTIGFLASDIYEEARDMVDLSVTQPFASGLEARVSVRNLGAKSRVLTRDGYLYDQTSPGRTVSLKITYSY
jgi:hypothetical protein